MSASSPPSSPSEERSRGRRTSENDANIQNFAPVARIMKMALPENAKIAKEAKECMQECVSEFISFITSEGKWSQIDEWRLSYADFGISIREVSTRETQDRQRRGHPLRYDFSRI